MAHPDVLAVSGQEMTSGHCSMFSALFFIFFSPLSHCFISMTGTSEPESHTSPPLTLRKAQQKKTADGTSRVKSGQYFRFSKANQ